MSTLYAVEVYVIATAFVGMLLLRRAGDRDWAEHTKTGTVRVDISIDTTGYVAALQKAAAAFEGFARAMVPHRPCGCPECAEHDRGCPEHPLNRGWQTALRYRSRALATRWHRWAGWRAQRAVDRHWHGELEGRWRP